jgi:hypothetical protein
MLNPSPRKRKSSDAKACRHQRLCCERLDPGSDSECDNIFRLLAPEIVHHILTFATLRSVVSLACATKSVHGYEPLAPQCSVLALPFSLSLFLLLLVISVLW